MSDKLEVIKRVYNSKGYEIGYERVACINGWKKIFDYVAKEIFDD